MYINVSIVLISYFVGYEPGGTAAHPVNGPAFVISYLQKQDSIFELEHEATENYSGNLFIANDLDTFHLDKQGELKKSGI